MPAFIGRRKRGAILSYFKLFLSFVAIVMAANIALSVAMYKSAERHSVRLVQTSTAEALGQISYSTNFMFEAAKMTLIQLYANPSVLKLMNQADLSELEMASLLNQVGSVHLNLPFLNSIYIYNRRAGHMYFDGKAYAADDFPDRDIVRRLREGGIANLRPIARAIPAPEGYASSSPSLEQTDAVYSFVFYDSSSSPIANAIVLNVSQQWLQHTIESMDPRVSGNTLVVDSAGQIVVGNAEYGYLSGARADERIAPILAAEAPAGHFIRTTEGRKELVTYVSSPLPDWKYIRFTPYAAIAGTFKQLVVWTWVIFGIVTVLSVLAALYISRFVYGLFNRKIRELETRHDREKNSDFSKKQQFLRLLASRELEEEVLRQRLARYQIAFRLELGFMTVVFKIDRYAAYCRQYTQADRELLAYGIMNVSSELAAPYAVHEAVDLGNGYLALLLNLDVQDSEAVAIRLERLAADIQDKVASYLGQSLSAALGEGVEELTDIPSSIARCFEALEYTLYEGPRALLHVSRIEAIKKKEYDLPEEAVKALIAALFEGDGEAMRRQCGVLVESTRGHAAASVQTMVLRLAMALKEGLQPYRALADEMNYGPFLELAGRIAELETLEELSERLHMLMARLLDVARRSQQAMQKYERYSEILQEVRAYVEADYANPNLSPDLIAQRFELSAKYLRTLYLKASGESLGESITRYRLERAKALLEGDGLTVQEAAERSGFVNVNYFYTLFKKYNGITPNEFRNRSVMKSR
ncbi:helix-turn-helix domain-containing protein [Paenibacillus sp. IB182496]|uniref:Helix-turn-helix domain-containing protein n=1 Tax=Paenibacillus sabuli TaxID=2772509 RepID=A0A927GSS2_9BACL|nr:cache domain-containing protein [Paenibacillus sabuli]MBD2846330.1 helix-turn-helix domain-containing protein [Paenibacillus sabuli]